MFDEPEDESEAMTKDVFQCAHFTWHSKNCNNPLLEGILWYSDAMTAQ